MNSTTIIKEAIWSQFGASLDMLENAIQLCPNEYWSNASDFWYYTYHCTFWTDYYLSIEPKNFAPPSPFTFSEFDPSGKKPDHVYTKTQILEYIEHCRKKAILLIENLTVEKLSLRWINEYKNFSMIEILFYNIRHIQHHTAQLNLLLRQTIDDAPKWVSVANKKVTFYNIKNE
jgi:hypothetical protein